MEILEHLKGKAVIRFSNDELVILNNALNEICNGVDIPQFETRVGYSRERVEALLEQINSVKSLTQ
jgi:hypothetical protein